MTSNRTDALIIFAKWPEPGRVKTRLSPPLSLQEAAELYRCMLLDTLDATSGIAGVSRLIFFEAPEERADDFRMLAPDAEVHRQNGKDLGERLVHALETAFEQGFHRAAVIGTDAPQMPVERITETFSLLERGETGAVFGPAEDGGYYLLALNSMQRSLFQDMPWSSCRLLQETVERAEEIGLTTSLLPPEFDLDSYEDLLRLASDCRTSAARLTRRTLAKILPKGTG